MMVDDLTVPCWLASRNVQQQQQQQQQGTGRVRTCVRAPRHEPEEGVVERLHPLQVRLLVRAELQALQGAQTCTVQPLKRPCQIDTVRTLWMSCHG